MIEIDTVLEKCPRCGAWPMAANLQRTSSAQPDVRFRRHFVVWGRHQGKPIQVAQACRAISDGGFFDLADVSQLSPCDRPSARVGQAGNPAFPAGQERILIALPVTEMHRYIAAKRGFECVVLECCVPRSDVFVQAAGGTNSEHRGQGRAGAGAT